MSDNILKTIQSILQDVIAPDLREMKTRVDAISQRFDDLERQLDRRFELMVKLLDVRFEAAEKQLAQQERLLLSAFAESQLRTEISGAKAVVDLRERVAVLESKAA